VPMTRLGARGLWLSFGTLSSRSTKALGLVHASRGYLTIILKDAAAAFFAFLKRIPSSGISRLDAVAFGRPEFVEAATKATMMHEEVYQQMAGAWRVVSGQQAELLLLLLVSWFALSTTSTSPTAFAMQSVVNS
jgi:hypothetical protein